MFEEKVFAEEEGVFEEAGGPSFSEDRPGGEFCEELMAGAEESDFQVGISPPKDGVEGDRAELSIRRDS
jgi:hypothetical protein